MQSDSGSVSAVNRFPAARSQFRTALAQLAKNRVAVEKLFSTKFAKIKLRQDAL